MEEQFQGLLAEGERLLWTGQPEPRLFAPADIFLVPFSLLWGGFAIVWETVALTQVSKNAGPVGVIFPIFGIPFVVAGLYMIFGRFIFKRWRQNNTYFAVSSQRVLIRYRGNLQSLYIDRLPVLDLSLNHATGIGTLSFGHQPFGAGIYLNTGLDLLPMQGVNVPSFSDIKDAQQVYDTINDVRRQMKTRQGQNA